MLNSIAYRTLLAFSTLSMAVATAVQAVSPSFVTFESGQVRPLALSPDGTKLYAVNTPDGHLEIFNVGAGGLTFSVAVPVGMEPVSVAAHPNGTEVWVVNHLSDSVSIVDVSASPPFVRKTLLVGDEARDIVFAGTANRAFISTAHRGQYREESDISAVTGAGNPQLTTQGVGRADVWVFDPASLGSAFGGTPVQIKTFFADTPRALATDGTTVYVAAFHSGNQTTVVNETLIPDSFVTSCGGGGVGQGVPGPGVNRPPSTTAPLTGVIVKRIGSNWVDALGCTWNTQVPFTLPDQDVFAFNANTLTSGTIFTGVGTILFNMAVHPSNGKIYVTNTELPNHIRFEGPGDFGGSTVQGHLSESRISVLNPTGATVDPQHLNQHIDYNQLHTDTGANHTFINGQAAHSLATPMQPVLSSDGNTMYVAAFGSSKIGVFATADIEDVNFETNFDPTVESASYLTTNGGGPSGLVLDETNNRLYVMTRFNNSVEVINLGSSTTTATHALHNPEPPDVIAGRPFLYDATLTSGNGEASCSSCHIFGDLDSLAWNLGNPDDGTSTNSQPEAIPILPDQPTFHPMKGPMTTQTLKGLATHGGMHWRGDRVDGFFGLDACNQGSGAPCSEDHSFRNFIVAFEGLVGKEGTITPAEMQQYANFALEMMLPPNPVTPLNNTLTGSAASGSTTFFNTVSDTVATCNGCHTTDGALGFFGTGGKRSFEGEPQDAKVPHMRNMYSKVGMFAASGNQIRGFGFLHDGSVPTIKIFVGAGVFSLNATEENNVEQFALRFPTDLAPIVGQQMTIGPANFSDGDVNTEITQLETRAAAAFGSLMLGGAVFECDVVAKTVEGGVEKGYVRPGGASNTYTPDDNGAAISAAALKAKADPGGAAQTITYTCVPPGSGTRAGIDRDEDDLGNGVETGTGVFVGPNDTGTNPALRDTDGDGFDDGAEVLAGSDPNDPFDPTPPAVPLLPAVGGAILGAALLLAGRLVRGRRSA